MFRIYLVPLVGTGTLQDSKRPKYFIDPGAIITPGVAISTQYYGEEGTVIVGADLSISDDSLVIGQPDVTALPFDLAATLTAGQVSAVKNKLESLNIPHQWVDTSDTWLDIVRIVLGISSFLSRYRGIYSHLFGTPIPKVFGGGITLGSTFGTLSSNIQTALIETALSFNISTAGLTANTTMRVILKALADNFSSMQYNFGGVLL